MLNLVIRIGNSTAGTVESPFWSYQLGLQGGWIPTDPRAAIGACGNTSPWQAPLAAWQTGGAGAGSIDPSVSASLPWPPTAISNAGAATVLPQYTATGPVPTLPAPTFTASHTTSFSVGNGWANAQDTQSAYVAIKGCSYPDPWSGVGASVPTAACTGPGAATAKRQVADPSITHLP